MLIKNVLVKLEIKNELLEFTHFHGEHEAHDAYISVGISPDKRLRSNFLYLNSVESAVKFSKLLEEYFSKHKKYKNAYRISLTINNLLDKTQTKHMEKDSIRVNEIVKDRSFDEIEIQNGISNLENQITNEDKDIHLIRSSLGDDRAINKTLSFYSLLRAVGFEKVKERNTAYKFKKYTNILYSIGFTEEDLKNLFNEEAYLERKNMKFEKVILDFSQQLPEGYCPPESEYKDSFKHLLENSKQKNKPKFRVIEQKNNDK